VEEEELGFLPGNINKKMDPWTRPIFDIFNEFYQKKDIEGMLNNNIIEISPLAFMRGRTFKNAYIIADEMQNSSPNQMLMLTTRIGEGSKMVITGDIKQTDRSMESGLSDFINKYNKYTSFLKKNETYPHTHRDIGIRVVELNNNDIERSKIIVKLLDIYDFKEPRPSPAPSPIPQVSISNSTVITPLVQKSNITTYACNDAALIPLSHMQKNHTRKSTDYASELGLIN
jgi:phosphate starvation-inducible protein PhoH